jgi:hypothetical protein
VLFPTGSGAGNNRTVTATYQDTQDPTVILTAPPAGPRRDEVLSVGANAGDNWGVARVEFLLDNVVVATDTTPGDGFAGSVDVTDWSQGTSFTIGERSVDLAGRQSAIASRTYTVDRVGPAPV